MSASLKVVTLALLSVDVSCLPGPDHFSKTVWATEKEVSSYDLKKGEIQIFYIGIPFFLAPTVA